MSLDGYWFPLPEMQASARSLSDGHLKQQIREVYKDKYAEDLLALVWGVYLCAEFGRRNDGKRPKYWPEINERSMVYRRQFSPYSDKRNAYIPEDYDHAAVREALIFEDPEYYLTIWPEMEEEF